MAYLDENYTIPSETKYMTFQEGENRIRILSPIIVGTEYWVEQGSGKPNKPKRVPPEVNVPVGDVAVNKYGNLSINPWWAAVVYNYADKKIQVLNITQRTVQRRLLELRNDEDWGELTDYDVVVNRTEGDRVEYSVTPKPKKPIAAEVEEQYDGMGINLEALYASEEFPYGGDPFAGEKIDPDTIPDSI